MVTLHPTPPPARPGVLHERRALLARLDGLDPGILTVVSAPPGYGKTTLASHWAERHAGLRVRWARLGPAGGSVTITDGLAGAEVLVLDDADHVDAAIVDGLLDAPALRSVRVLVLTRRDVVAALAAHRAAGSVDLLHARDLAVDEEELRHLVATVSGVEIDAGLADAITRSIGGWPTAAVHLAGAWPATATSSDHAGQLAMAIGALAKMATERALDGLDREVIEALGSVAVLPELHGDLWNEILGRDDGDRVLARLRSEGRMVLPSTTREDLLRLHAMVRAGLLAGGPSDRAPLLQKAATWYDEHKLPLSSARCHADLGDWDAMGAVILANVFGLLDAPRHRELADLLATLPPEVLEHRYMWASGIAFAFLIVGEHEGAEAVLDAIGPGTTLAHQIPALNLRSNIAGYREDPTPYLEAAEEELRLCEEAGDDYAYDDLYTVSRTQHWRCQARSAALVAGAYLGFWDRVRDHEEPVDPMSMVEIPPHGGLVPTLGRRSTYFALGGWLGNAFDEATTALGLLPDAQPVQWMAEAYLGLGEAHRGRGRWADAEAALTTAFDVARDVGRHTSTLNAAAGLALLHLDRARPDAAAGAIAAGVAATAPFRPPHTVAGRWAAARALTDHRLGDGAAAQRILEMAPRTPTVSLAAVQIALELGDADAAWRWLGAGPDEPTLLGKVADAAARSAVCEVTGRRVDAVDHLRPAVLAAAAHGLLQPIAQVAVLGLRPVRVLADDPDPVVAGAAAAVVAMVQPGAPCTLLSDRERLVLHHLASTASMRQIAERLLVSPNTLRTQIRAIYRKLGVGSRPDAVATLRATLAG